MLKGFKFYMQLYVVSHIKHLLQSVWFSAQAACICICDVKSADNQVLNLLLECLAWISR